MKTGEWIAFIICWFSVGFVIVFCLHHFSSTTAPRPMITCDQAFDSAIINIDRSTREAGANKFDSAYFYSGKSHAYFEIRKLLLK